MKTSVIRKKDIKELRVELLAKQKEMSEIKFDLKVGKEKDSSRRKKLKKDVARILTIINELKTMNLVTKSDKIDDSLKTKV